MNTRRKLLKLLGLGSLFATGAAVTVNQAQAAKGMTPPSPGFVSDEIHEVPEWCRPKFPPYTRTKWQYRVARVDIKIPDGGPNPWSPVDFDSYNSLVNDQIAAVINRETEDGSEFVSMSEWKLIFRKRVLWTA